MTFERVVRQTFEAIQYDGTNLKEVFDFFNSHHANANSITYEELVNDCSRPNEIPLDVSSSTLYYEEDKKFREKWKSNIDKYRASPLYADEADFFPEEFFKERDRLRNLGGDWRKGEEYHVYLSTEDGYCRMVGISKGDWFYTGIPTGQIENYSEDGFKSFLEDYGFTEVKNG